MDIKDLIESVCEIYNYRLKVFRIADQISELAEHGVSLPPNMQSLISKDFVEQGKALTKELVNEAFLMLSGAVTIVYPMGLPPYDPIQMELKNEEELSGTHAGTEVIPSEDAALWFSGKEMLPGKLLSDYVGRNEKTKVIVKIQKRGAGAPAREAVISEADQRALMAYYYRRQEELKKLEENDDDSYLNSAWSEPGQLKRQFHGLSDIKWGPR
ncbi:unnamed protein product [Hydatigera taeniaeformis]|uniref:UPF0769 protein C21orf59 homolog n=1 Tax=Hydatigena taeniaeformis TaxID=6205 RepID=A0A0R3XAG7_HYDTA|nr:unnamed protein product [Hydatigera taeniaeformis]